MEVSGIINGEKRDFLCLSSRLKSLREKLFSVYKKTNYRKIVDKMMICVLWPHITTTRVRIWGEGGGISEAYFIVDFVTDLLLAKK